MIIGGGWCVFSTWSQAGKKACGVWSFRHYLAIWAFLAWWFECSSHCETAWSMPQEHAVRNEHSAFQLEHEFSYLFYVNCWGLQLSRRVPWHSLSSPINSNETHVLFDGSSPSLPSPLPSFQPWHPLHLNPSQLIPQTATQGALTSNAQWNITEP